MHDTFDGQVAKIRRQLEEELPRSWLPRAFYPMPRSDQAEPPSQVMNTSCNLVLTSNDEQLTQRAVAVDDVTTITPYQKRAVKLMQRIRGHATFIRQFTILPEMDIDRLVTAWDLVCSRFPSLRTRVVLGLQDRRPRLVTMSTWEKLKVCHYSNSAAAEADLDSMRLAAGSFNSTLARAAIVHIADGAGGLPIFACAMNHLIYDAVSIANFWRALSESYRTGCVSQIVELPFRRLTEYLAGLDPKPARYFWKQYLDGAPPSPFPAVVKTTSTVGPGTPAAVRPSMAAMEFPFARGGSRITTTTLVRAAFGLTIGSYTCSTDVTFRELLWGRSLPIDGIESVAGPTCNLVAVRVRISDDDDMMTISDLLAQIQEDGADILEHETLGFDAISDLSPGIARVIDSFNCQLIVRPPVDENGSEPALPMKAASWYEDLTGSLALVLTCRLQANGMMVFRALHDLDVLDGAGTNRMLTRFRQFLEALSAAESSGTTLGVLRTTATQFE